MTADELLIVNLIPFCQQHVAKMPRRFQNVTTRAVRVGFKRSRREIEAQRHFGTGQKLLNDEVAFGRSVRRTVVAASTRLRTARTANTTVVFKRPPKGARDAHRVTENFRVTEGYVWGRETAGAETAGNDFCRVLADVVMRPNPRHQLGRKKIRE